MIKNECKLVRDLFPNYIEELLSNETKEFIENHISNCNECKELLERLREEKDIEINRRDFEAKSEINYLKKFRRKFFTLKSIIVLFTVIIIIICAIFFVKFSYNRNILNKAYEKLQEIENSDNFKLSVEEYSVNYKTERNDEWFHNTTYYYKDRKYKEVWSGKITYDTLIYANRSYYGEIDSNKRIEFYEDEKEIINNTANYNFMTKQRMIDREYSYTRHYGRDYGIILNLIAKGGLNIKTERYNGKECYVVSLPNYDIDFTEIWIEKESMLVLREITGVTGRYYNEKKYTIEIGNVSNEDVIVPKFDGYDVVNKETMANPIELEFYNK